MAAAKVTYTFTVLDNAQASKVNQNFRDLTTFLNNDVLHVNGWTEWTPTLTQSGTVAATVNSATYVQIGKIVIANFRLTATGTGVAGNGVGVSLPVAAARTQDHVGSVRIFDSSTTTSYAAVAFLVTASEVRFRGDWSANGAWGFVPSIAVGANDAFIGTIIYEAA